eukprot:CAMPEP_0115010604 /NCGR_PEP_ID=MMETSP0216-20121206/23420_1 /TAXON_ID=223996 /ORGANISM="Protocruzia adherens, Strain Boccale" /LENGTH=289 /DNA_ID=CAMNT_0002378861 /DNA_START=109 /DNA_END=978 /DNA_ORIENTATION=-
MIRKNTRLRKEYLYKKGQEQQEKIKMEKKLKIKAALEQNKAIPTELKAEEKALRHEIDLEDKDTFIPTSHIDDEYALAGVKEPRILVTTSRDPSSRLMQFSKEMRLIFPNAERVNRGTYIIKDLVEMCQANQFTDMLVVHEHRGRPDGLIISHMPYGPTAYFALENVTLRHDLPTKPENISEAYPHLIFNNFESRLGRRVSDILKYLFPVPKIDSKRVLTFHNQDDIIIFRHHTYKKDDHKTVLLEEQGPRFDLKLYQIVLGNLDMKEASKEWVLRPYMNTAKKRKILS